jgi:hypothetical protein
MIMKRAILAILAVTVLMFTAIAASAGNMPRVRADVPFEFYAGDQLLPAGTYVFEMVAMGRGAITGSTILVRTRDNSIAFYLPARPGRPREADLSSRVVFHKYGDKYFLAEVNQPELGTELPKNKIEKELLAASKRVGPQEVPIASAK